jgi:hypothetical protein
VRCYLAHQVPWYLERKYVEKFLLSLAYLSIEVGHNLASGESVISILPLLIVVLFSCLTFREYFSKGEENGLHILLWLIFSFHVFPGTQLFILCLLLLLFFYLALPK